MDNEKVEPTFEININHDQAWLLRNTITPGPRVGMFHVPDEVSDTLYDLRTKVNYSILRFLDEPDLESVEIDITEDQGWLIDSSIRFDGLGGTCTNLLTQIFRGLWGLDHGLPGGVVSDPRAGWSNSAFRALRSREEGEGFPGIG